MKQWTLFAAAAGFSLTQVQAGVLFDFPNFSSTNGLTLAGNAGTATTGDGTVLRLTPAAGGQTGAAYSTTAVTLGANDTFSTTFQFRFTDQGGVEPADGITFVLAASPTGLGSSGEGLGYQGVNNSLAIEFDTYDNEPFDDGSSNHVSIDTDGNLTDLSLTNLYGVAECDFSAGYQMPGCLSNGDLWTVTIGFDGTSLSLVAQDGSAAPFAVYSALPIDIASYLGTNTAYVGFTGGTGSGYENQDVVNWQFANTTQLATATPEPATLPVLLGGLAALALMRRRFPR